MLFREQKLDLALLGQQAPESGFGSDQQHKEVGHLASNVHNNKTNSGESLREKAL